MVAQKRDFPFGIAALAQKSADERQAEALEYIALYLDRIDDHLGAIAKTADANGSGFLMLREGLKEIVVAMKSQK